MERHEADHQLWQHKLVGKSFCVRVKRVGAHEFTSTEVERYVGGGPHQHIATAGVKLKHTQCFDADKLSL